MNMKIFWRDITFKNFLPQKKKSFWGYATSSFKSLFDNDVVLDKRTYYNLYQNNGDIRQAVRKIAENVARNGLYLIDNQWNIIDDNKVTDDITNLFASPTFSKFKIDFFRNFLVGWEVYIIPAFNAFWKTAWFQILDNRMVSKTINQETWEIIKFDVYINGTKHITYTPEQLAFFKLEDDIRNWYDWMSLLTWIVYDWLSDLEAMKNNYYFYQNSAIPSAILLLDETIWEEETQILKDQFEAQFKWSKNNHKTLIGWGIKDIKTLSMTPRDMEFINQRNLTTEKVSAVFWVPKTILWYTNNVNYSNWQTLRREFIEWTVRPYEKEFEFCLNRCLQMFRPDLFNKFWVKADWDQFDQSQEEKQAQVEDIRHGIRTINEVRVERGYQKVDDENADKLLIRSDLGLLEDIVFNSVMPSNDWGTTEEDNSNSNSNEEWKQNDEKDNEGVWKNGEDNGEWRNS